MCHLSVISSICFLTFVCEYFLHSTIADMFSNVNNIYVDRTVLKENAYINEFLSILHSNERTINLVLAFSAFYRKKYYFERNFERRQIENAELRYSMKIAKKVREEIIREDVSAFTIVTAVLFSHHVTLNSSMHSICWTKYLYSILNSTEVNLEANLTMTSVAILAMTTLLLNEKHSFQHFNFHWIECDEAKQLIKVNSTLKLSRMIFYFIYLIIQKTKIHTSETRDLLSNIWSILKSETSNVFCKKLTILLNEWMNQKM